MLGILLGLWITEPIFDFLKKSKKGTKTDFGDGKEKTYFVYQVNRRLRHLEMPPLPKTDKLLLTWAQVVNRIGRLNEKQKEKLELIRRAIDRRMPNDEFEIQATLIDIQ